MDTTSQSAGRRPRARCASARSWPVPPASVLCAIGFVVDRDQFFRSWLIAFLLFLGISLGSMALMMIQHLTGGAWGVFRRVFEASSRTMPLMALLFVPIALGMTSLYPWTHGDLVAGDEILQHKAPYLNTPFFLLRAVFYFAGWIRLACDLNRWSKRQDDGRDEGQHLDPAPERRRPRLLRAHRHLRGHRLDHVDQPALVLDAVRVPDDGRSGALGAGVHHHRQPVPEPAAADVGAAQAASLPRPRQAVAGVRDALGVLQLLPVPPDLRRQPGRRSAVLPGAHGPRLAVPGDLPGDLPLLRAVLHAAVARQQAGDAAAW